ncbi:preprotein translocase, YajC subunit domain protein [Streptococcus sp. oral taxon 056 str. F0418]|nr:preprotein translocase, YajC subunit domain protein [Streptococcus sp. oral taxon 056 str. F0418]
MKTQKQKETTMGIQMIIMFVVMAGLIFYMNRTQKNKQKNGWRA